VLEDRAASFLLSTDAVALTTGGVVHSPALFLDPVGLCRVQSVEQEPQLGRIRNV
jgi:hypothetical protein